MLTRNVISAYPGYMLKHCQTHWCSWSLSEAEVVQVGSFLMNPLKPCTSVSADIYAKFPECQEITCIHMQVLLGGSFHSTECLCTLQCSLSLLEWCCLGDQNTALRWATARVVLSCEYIMHWVYQAHTVNLRCLSNNWTFRFVWKTGGGGVAPAGQGI